MKKRLKQLSRWLLGSQRSSTLIGASRRLAGGLSETNVLDAELKKLLVDPTNPKLHGAFAKYLAQRGRSMAAFAEYRTAKHLGWTDSTLDAKIDTLAQQLPATKSLNHNRYYRLKTLADSIIEVAGGRPATVLDVGGGDGALAQFIPLEFGYCLAEPKTNSISGENLPFAARSFDIVTSCHVLEHVPQSERYRFLDNLVEKSRGAVVLLNPFDNRAIDAKTRMNLLWEITHAPWVREHMECGLPTIDFVTGYAAQRDLKIAIKPNGSVATSMAIVLLNHFAKQSKRPFELEPVYAYFNSLPDQAFDSAAFPNALIVTLQRGPS